MQYLLLIYQNQTCAQDMTPEEMGAEIDAYSTFTQDLVDSGQFVGTNALQPVQTATTVRVRDGQRTVTDGPFAETREQLGGYYVIEAENLDAALAIAARIPTAKVGCIEVRPVMTFD